MLRTSKSRLAHATMIAGAISLLLSSSAFAGFNGAGGFRGGSFGVARAATPSGPFGSYPGSGAIGSVHLGATNPNPIPRQKGKPRVNGGGCLIRPCNY